MDVSGSGCISQHRRRTNGNARDRHGPLRRWCGSSVVPRSSCSEGVKYIATVDDTGRMARLTAINQQRRISQRRLQAAGRANGDFREYNRARNARTVGKSNHGERWTFEDIDKCFDATKSDQQLSDELCRSLLAIRGARCKHKVRAPEGWKPKGSEKIEGDAK